MHKAITYDGRLYNSHELRNELQSLGHSFNGKTDEELILHAYEQWNENCVNKFNGVFAFVLWDAKQQRQFIARDRFGVKPLFYAVQNGEFVFASNVRELNIRKEIDESSIAEIMLLGPGRTPGCGVYKNVHEVLPAHCGYFYEGEGTLKLWRYWKLEDSPHTDSFEQTVEKVRELVRDSIKRQIVSDKPIACFLSGGLDSSIIATIAGGLPSFSVDYHNNDRYFKASHFQPNSDQEYINEMSEFLGKGHKHMRILLDSQQLADSLYEAVDARGFPGMADIDTSLLLFCKEVKKHVDVAVSGECADEIFGGYPWYRDKDVREYEGFPWSRSLEYRKSFLRPEVMEKIEKISDDYVMERYHKCVADASVLESASPLERRMKEMMNLNINWFMQTLLDRTDRMSRYCGLEVRVPFCDYRIVEYLYNIPWEIKDYKGREKGLLRQAMEGVLPENILWRKKSPYPKTHNPAYLQIVSAMLSEIIKNPKAPILEFVRKEALEDLIAQAERGTSLANWYGQLMATPQTIAYFLQFNYWLGNTSH